MSLLDNQNSIEIKLYYKYIDTEYGKKLIIIDNDKAQKLLEDKEKSKTIEILKTTWNLLTWKEQNDVMNKSSHLVNPQTGERQFDFIAYRDTIVKKCLKDWNIQENEKPIPVTSDAIDRLPGTIVTILYEKFEELIDYTEKELGN